MDILLGQDNRNFFVKKYVMPKLLVVVIKIIRNPLQIINLINKAFRTKSL